MDTVDNKDIAARLLVLESMAYEFVDNIRLLYHDVMDAEAGDESPPPNS